MLDKKKWQGGRIRGGKLGLKSTDKTINEHKYFIFRTEVPTTLPRAGEPPVTEKDWAGLFAVQRNIES